MNNPENQKSEQEFSPEQYLTRITEFTRQTLDDCGTPSVVEADGTQVRILSAPNVTSASYTMAELTETSPIDESPKKYTYSYVLLDRPMDTQVLTWSEGDDKITHGVRFTVRPQDNPRTVKEIDASEVVVRQLEGHMENLSGTHANNLIEASRHANQRSTSVKKLTSWIFGKK
jgi:hypothetical protein